MRRRNHQAQHWQPANRQHYCLILADGGVRRLQWHDTIFDYAAWSFGNCFREREEAEQARDGLHTYFAHLHGSVEGTGLPTMGHGRHSLSALADKLATLPAGETLVAVVGGEEGHYLFIGNTLAPHLWAITTRELQCLKEIVNAITF